ncbi:hypothetical protein QOZ93_001530 [Hathewaya limosa]|uniref:Phage protein n=2 Tax=Hathewaya limosa TaxID=1536 RepID=A0ABU0JRT5_HATLI|nr:hypothetical protein [Hathewaya limosa]
MQLINNFKIGLTELQRGVGNVNPMKMARCIMELERIYGIRQGSANEKGINQYIGQSDNLTHQKTQVDLAKQLAMSKQQLSDYKKLNELIPELQSLVETGDLKSTTAYKIWAKCPNYLKKIKQANCGFDNSKRYSKKGS